MTSSSRRSAVDWVDAAYDCFTDGGLAAVRVEVVARRLGTSKGSFYWHFADRAALVNAVVERWEARETERFIAAAEALGGTAQERLFALFTQVAASRRERDGEAGIYREAEGHGVAAAVRRVSERRVGYLSELLAALGFEAAEARRRAIASLAIVLGLQQLALVGFDERVDDAALVLTAFVMATGEQPHSGGQPAS